MALWFKLTGNREAAKRVLSYAKRHFLYYDNRSPKKGIAWNAFVFRQWQLFAAFKIAADEKLNWFDLIWITKVINLALKRKDGDQDGWTLTCALVKITRGIEYDELQAARQDWITVFRVVYPKGYGEVLSRKAMYHGAMSSYFDPKHPTCIYLEGEYGE